MYFPSRLIQLKELTASRFGSELENHAFVRT